MNRGAEVRVSKMVFNKRARKMMRRREPMRERLSDGDCLSVYVNIRPDAITIQTTY